MTTSNAKADILFITVNEHESSMLRAELKAIGATPTYIQSSTTLEPYEDYGEINGQRVMHAISMMGSGQAGGSRETTKKAIDDLQPQLLIAVGICWGAQEEEQKIGDVIISQQVQMSSNLKVKDQSVIPRGPRPEVGPTPIKILKLARAKSAPDINIHTGLMISADTLFDDKKHRDMYRDGLSGLKGGEMEAMGIYEAIRDANFKTDWLVVKGICDWGYKKSQDASQKELDQAKAAQQAAKLCAVAIRDYKLVVVQSSNREANAKNDQDIASAASDKKVTLEEIAKPLVPNSTSSKIVLQFRCAPMVLPIYKEFSVELQNPEALAFLKSKLLLDLPSKISVQLSDLTDYANLILTNTQYQREDLIEAAKIGVENRRAGLETRIAWCVEAIRANGRQGVGDLEQCIASLCGRKTESSGESVQVDIVNRLDRKMYFNAELPAEAVLKIATDRNCSRPLSGFEVCDLFDLPTSVVYGHVLPSYAFYRDIGRPLPSTFRIADWWWGEA